MPRPSTSERPGLAAAVGGHHRPGPVVQAWVLSSLPEFQPVVVIDGFWNWYRTYNTGAAFSFLSDAGGWQKYFFTALAIAISGLMAWWLRGTARGNWKAAVPYALIIGGAIGNVIDRGARPRGRFHPVVRGQLHLALVQHRRFGHRGGCHRHRPVGLFDGKSAKRRIMPIETVSRPLPGD